MKDFSLRQVLGLLAKTTPFLVFRFLICFGIALGYFLMTGKVSGKFTTLRENARNWGDVQPEPERAVPQGRAV